MKYYLVKVRYQGQFSFAQEPLIIQAKSPEQAMEKAMGIVPVEAYYAGEPTQAQIDLHKKRNEAA